MAAEDTESTVKLSKSGKKNLPAIIIVGALMVLEGAGVYLLAKAISPPPLSALAIDGSGGGDGAASTGSEEFAEIAIAECRPSNMMAGKFVTFHIRVSALVAAVDVARAEAMVRNKRARLEDAVNTVIRSCEPKQLKEPGLESIKRRLKHEIDVVLGDAQLVRDVLIPQLLQSGPGV